MKAELRPVASKRSLNNPTSYPSSWWPRKKQSTALRRRRQKNTKRFVPSFPNLPAHETDHSKSRRKSKHLKARRFLNMKKLKRVEKRRYVISGVVLWKSAALEIWNVLLGICTPEIEAPRLCNAFPGI